MEKIASFRINHNILPKGMYISRVDGDIVTYDIRMRRPNKEPVMENAAIHTIEHLFATYVRNTKYSDDVIYFGPMGCRTGFYFLLRSSVSHTDAIKLAADAFRFIMGYEGEIPGATETECGNYREHDLAGAKKEAEMIYEFIKDRKSADLYYPE
ncbi:MAG: S-ribosylhomocysteine lyase [Acutalibacteraceae bacterium]